MALTVGLAPTLFPQTTGCFSISATRAQNSVFWTLHSAFKVVGSAGNAPVRRFRHIFKDARFTVEQPDHLPEIGSGSGNHTHLKEFMRLLSVL